MSRLRATLFCVVLALAWIAPDPALAHGRSLSYSSWTITRDGALVRVRIPRLELTRLAMDPVLQPGTQMGVVALLANEVRLSSHGEPCPPSVDPALVPAAEGWVAYEWVVRCPAPGEPVIESTLLLDVAPTHLHFARAQLPDGSVRESVLSATATSWALGPLDGAASDAAPHAAGMDLRGYVALGIEHIVTGYDHIAFVLALLLVAASLREVAGLVTGFTIAHSLTLALATLGLLHPKPHAVEALIGFSIALVASENAWLLGGRPRALPWAIGAALVLLAVASLAGFGEVAAPTLVGLALFSVCHFAMLDRARRPARLRAAVAFAFGLVHGFGFAGVLAEMDLPRERLVPALFGFNVGVELGQLAVVALVWPLLAWLARARDRRWYAWIAEGGSAVICGLGLYWFTTRLFG